VKKVIGMVVLGIVGLAAAIALTVGALALAGNDVGSVVQPALASPGSRSASSVPSPSGEEDASSTPSPSVDDHGGGSGSDNSGSGSDNSGSGSDNSGSGSDDSPDDD
jgi:hypothetical protein